MACKCCTQYAPKHHDGSPLPPCAGTAAIDDARDFARIWRKRALDAGWKSPAQKSEEKSREKHTGEKPRPFAPSASLKEKSAAHLAEALSLGMEVAYCQGPDRHHILVDSEGYEAFVGRGCFHCGAFPEVSE